jgi:tetratricopeptide (TPR) repeat protein
LAEKLDRKQLKRPDEFQVKAGQAMEWMVAHQRPLLAGLIAAAALVLIAWGFTAWRGARESKAGAALSEALDLQSRPIAGEGAQPGVETFPGKEEREKAVMAALEKVRSEHPNTAAGTTALAEIGFRKLKSGEAAGAQKDLEAFLQAAPKDHPLRIFAAESLGYAFEAQNKLDEARAAFEKLRELGMAERADFQAARLDLVQGKPDAKAKLEKVAKDYPKDPVSMEANLRLELAALPEQKKPQGKK